jgi:hypothetical protein
VRENDDVPPAPPPLDWTFVDELACKATANMVTRAVLGDDGDLSPPCPLRTWLACTAKAGLVSLLPAAGTVALPWIVMAKFASRSIQLRPLMPPIAPCRR